MCKIKKILHDVLDLPIYENQMQKDLSWWIECVRHKINRRKIHTYNRRLQEDYLKQNGK